MQFVVQAKDESDSHPRRMAVLDAHRDYLDFAPSKHNVQVLLSGPLMDDSGAKMVGSFFLLDAPDRGCIEALLQDDPLMNAQVWASLAIDAVSIRQDNLSAK